MPRWPRRAQGQRCGEPQPQAAAAADEAPGDGEQAQPEPFRFPAAGGPGQGEHLHPGQQFAGQGDDLAPELVLGVARAAAGCAGRCPWRSGSGPRTGPGAGGAARGRRAGRPWRWWRRQVNRCPSRSVNRSCAPGCGRSLRTMTRIPAGQAARSSMPVMSATHAPVLTCAAAVVGGRPGLRRDGQDGVGDVLGDGEADRVVQPPVPAVSQSRNSCVPPPESARISTWRRRCRGSCASAEPGRLDMVRGGVRPGVPRPQHDGQRLPAPVRRRGRRRRSAGGSRRSSSRSGRPAPSRTRTGSRQGVQGSTCSARVGWRPMPGVRSRRSLSTLPAR